MSFRHVAAWVVVALGFVAAAAGQAPPLPERGVAAHRGASTTHPENTIPAIEEAVRLGARQIEIDVRLTSDGRLVLLHDATLDRTTDVAQVFPARDTREVAAYTFDEVRRLDAGGWKGARFAGLKIPTLEEALAVIPRDRWVNLDVKGERELGAATAREVLRLGRERECFLSLRGAAREGALEVAQGRLLLNNMERQSTSSEYVDRTIEGGFDFIQFLHDPFPSDEDIARLKDAGVRINYCCSNDPEEIRRWFEAGIEFPLVDDVAAGVDAVRHAGVP